MHTRRECNRAQPSRNLSRCQADRTDAARRELTQLNRHRSFRIRNDTMTGRTAQGASHLYPWQMTLIVLLFRDVARLRVRTVLVALVPMAPKPLALKLASQTGVLVQVVAKLMRHVVLEVLPWVMTMALSFPAIAKPALPQFVPFWLGAEPCVARCVSPATTIVSPISIWLLLLFVTWLRLFPIRMLLLPEVIALLGSSPRMMLELPVTPRPAFQPTSVLS